MASGSCSRSLALARVSLVPLCVVFHVLVSSSVVQCVLHARRAAPFPRGPMLEGGPPEPPPELLRVGDVDHCVHLVSPYC